MSEWRDISTAPKDGTQFLIVRDDGEYELCEWCEHLPLYDYVHVQDDLYRRVQVDRGPGFWNGNIQCAVGWKPLPPPPVSGKA